MNRPLGLGKGLDALIPKKTPGPSPLGGGSEIALEIPVEAIKPNPRQPRQEFREEELAGLCASIEAHGILQPLVVMKAGDGYELIAGERRLRAARRLGLKTVPVVVRAATEQTKLELSLIENLQRQNLNPIEEAKAFRALSQDFYLTHEEIARRVGRHRSVISNTIRLLDLPADIQQAVAAGQVAYASARALLSLATEERQQTFDQLMRGEKLTTRDIERKTARRRVTRDPNLEAAEARLREKLETRVIVSRHGPRGAITIEFYSDEDLKKILDRLLGG